MELVDELCWILEDSSRHIAGRIHAATQRYLSNLLPPLANAMVMRFAFCVWCACVSICASVDGSMEPH